MAQFNLAALNSGTKYPSISTYHTLVKGTLTQEVIPFTGNVTGTEKVDGTNGRFIVTPDGDWFIGSRENLLCSRGDRLFDPAQGIVKALRPLAEKLAVPSANDFIKVYYLEVYGHNIQAAAKEYASGDEVGYRLFDVAKIPVDVPFWAPDQASTWREAGGQEWLTESELLEVGKTIELTPRLFTCMSESLPTGLEETLTWMQERLPHTKAALSDTAGGLPEGLVLRTADRSVIAKVRFEDYGQSLKKRRKEKKS